MNIDENTISNKGATNLSKLVTPMLTYLDICTPIPYLIALTELTP